MRKTTYGIAVVILDPEGRVVMQHRDNKPGIAYPDHWSVPTGGIRVDGDVTWKTAIANAKREIEAELGLGLGDDDFEPCVCETLEKPTQDIVRYVLRVERRIAFEELRPFDADGCAKEGRTWNVLTESEIFDGRLIPPTIIFLLERFFGRRLFGFMARDASATTTIARELLQRFDTLTLRRVVSDDETRPVAIATRLLYDESAAGDDVLHISYEDPESPAAILSKSGPIVSFVTNTIDAPKLHVGGGHMRLITPRSSR